VDTTVDTAVPARRAVEALLDRVADDAAAVGATEALDRVGKILRDGTSADRQIVLHRHGMPLPDLVQSLVAETCSQD
jgi:gamma-glutamyl:cysteine ligase YbdK (ATP-grasp superfamily)